MSISSVSTAAASAARLDTLSGQAALQTLRKALDIQAATALQLLQSVPVPVPPSQAGQQLGGNVDTYA
ncbi:MAG: YjfB family protein [Rhodocyclaceae bacterium]|nr:YjfB family protein [Rhodocyclaceae bacterium]MCP5238785.1 YjfB family protein [Zoogloeaceae bacterium]MCW5614138.1 YjfB family protein [Rhodocyclaceae bacterium]